ncbi:S41 family peptidase [Candidatus Marinarcus aquaticus]|uniref:Peptidase S41 n=1 Tax=Candidatus Marinarcus aquaticus TaxID=2044504 RepID=A0A4Q0XME8_9BACT|nr:S41 family peptidase [Candidatus Marinarcus aquaticus]RXJ54464.1 peptidase S41 [Candidatus Marinarcus aquaticus]
MKSILFSFFYVVAFVSFIHANEVNTLETKSDLDNETTQTRFESLSKLTKVIGTVEKYYVDDIKLQEIVNKALKGLMQELDAHSTYMDKKYFKEMQIQTNGEFGGLGITVGMRDGALTVISPIDDTPAYKAGVKAGDIILKIDDTSTLNITLDEAVGLMRGKPKTPIELTLVRKGENKPILIKIIRDIIKIQSVYSKTIGDDVLYLRVTSFDKNVDVNMRKAINKNKTFKGIILDLRNNPGGLLNQAISVTDFFVNSGVIVSQKGRDESSEEKFSATSANTLTSVPLVVLVNAGSASASEIVSGALQDHKRAIVVGEKTFGKGSVQVILPITDDKSEGVKLTIAKYYLPSGRTIQATGITPDIIAYAGEVPQESDAEFKIKEADLKKHLEGELEKVNHDEVKTKEEKKNSDVITKEELFKDNQLKTGVDILKSLIIMKK